MAHQVFGNTHQCEIIDIEQNTFKCQAIKRIQIILHEFNDDQHEPNLVEKFATIFISNGYTNTSLLNDFHHIKYTHHADDDDSVFSKIHTYFVNEIGTVCNEKQCRFISRHYRDRSTLQNQLNDCILSDEKHDNDGFNPHDRRYMMDLISRIHVYFIHSYHLNRFTMHELRLANQQIERHQLDEDASDDMRMQLLTDIMNAKRNIIGIERDNDKFKEPMSINKHNHEQSAIDYAKMHDILHKHGINIGMHDLRSAFSAYTGNDKDTLIADLIDAYFALNDTSLPLSNVISITSLHCDYTHRQAIYRIILFHYFEKRDINAAHFIKIAETLLTEHYPGVDISAFGDVAMNAHINGNTFTKGTPGYRNSLQFAKMFKSIKGYKKKDFTNLY
eukprot:230386_1